MPHYRDTTEPFAMAQAEAMQPDGSCIGAVAAIVFAKNVEMVQVFVAPIKEHLDHEVELGGWCRFAPGACAR